MQPLDDMRFPPFPKLMGILNVTPDSFSDGGRYNTVETALSRAREMIVGGVDVIDVGGESTRPGAQPVPATEQIRRVCPVIEALRALNLKTPVPISIDTQSAEVATAAIQAGATWTSSTDDRGRCTIVSEYFRRSGGWNEPVAQLRTPAGAWGDPLYAVWAEAAR